MKKITLLVLLCNVLLLDAQQLNPAELISKTVDLNEINYGDENFEGYEQLKKEIHGVEIIMLGEQSHMDATTFKTKIKLIKYLHQELGFNLLVFESGIYDVYKAWEAIQQGMPVRDALGHSMSYLWSTTKDIVPLADYIEENKDANELKLLGFDSQFYTNFSKNYLVSDLSTYLAKVDGSILQTKEWLHLKQNLEYSFERKFKELKKNQPELDTLYLDKLCNNLLDQSPKPKNQFWIQTLKSLKTHFADLALGKDGRDRQMADNLFWIKTQYPDSKIICWGATSHFLYNSTQVRMSNPIIQLLAGSYLKNSPRMGNFVKEKYKDKVYTIGFTTFSGSFGLDKGRKIKPAKNGSLEFILSQSENDNLFLPLDGWNLKNHQARPLGNKYMKNNIADVMDAVIFNRYMRPTQMDRNFYYKIYPEYK